MDQAQQKALNALEPYILLSKSATSPRAAVDLINQATSAPNTFVFTELLQTPNIQALNHADTEHACYYELLQIFACGTWWDYTEHRSTLPRISATQSTKLRQLTLLTLCLTPTELNYSNLSTVLSLSIRDIEDLVISCVYAGLLVGQLNPLAQRIDVSSVSPVRDLRPGSISRQVAIIEDWEKRSEEVLSDIEARVNRVKKQALEKKQRENAAEQQRKKLMEAGDSKGKRGVGDTMDAEMDMGAEENVGNRMRNAKRGGRQGFMGLGKKLGGG